MNEQRKTFSTAKAVQSTTLSLKSIDDVHRGDCLALGMLSVRDGISDDILKEDFEDAASFFVDQTRDALDTATTRQTANSGLGDALDVVAQNFAVTLGASFSQTLTTFASASHVVEI